MKKTLNVVYATDFNFIKYFSVSLTSLFENNKDLDLRVFVIHDCKDTTQVDIVQEHIKRRYKNTINLVYLDSSIFDKYKIDKHVSKAAYFRLLMAEILPAEIETVFFIDSDTVVSGSLRQIADLTFSNSDKGAISDEKKYLYAASEVEPYREINSKRISELGYPTERYFNSGVMYINLKQWRLDNVTGEFLKVAHKHMPDLKYWDQDVLNIFFVNQWSDLERKFNVVHLVHRLPELPVIIHYAGPSKPWHYLNNHPYQLKYVKYFKKSPFSKSKTFVDFTLRSMLRKHYYLTKGYLKNYINNPGSIFSKNH